MTCKGCIPDSSQHSKSSLFYSVSSLPVYLLIAQAETLEPGERKAYAEKVSFKSFFHVDGSSDGVFD